MHLEYKNRAELEVTACGGTHTIFSNEVEAKKIVIRVIKTQNKQCVFEGDQLEYKVKICNDSKFKIDNPIFCDGIPEGLRYVPNSFKVNGKHESPQEMFGNRISYQLKDICAGDEVIVTFCTTVL